MNLKENFKIPIAVKLITITTGLLLLASALIAYQSASRFETISMDREEDANRDQSRARATEVEGLFIGYIDKVKVIASLLMKDYPSEEAREKDLELTFRKDNDLVAVEVVSIDSSRPSIRVVNEEYLKNYKLNKRYIETLRESQKAHKSFQQSAVFAGEIEIRNSSLEGGAPLLTIGIPLVQDSLGRFTHIALAEVRLDRLQKVFGNISERTIYLVDKEGKLLAHPDEAKVFRSESMADVPIVKAALSSQFKQEQLRFTDEKTQESFTAAFTKTALGVTAIALASEDVILEAARAVKREAFYIAGQILSVALFLIFVFSISLTAPIEKLVEITTEVAKGNFDVKADIHSRDEVGQLGTAFDSMIVGLQERDKVKNMFAKFHGSSVADDLLKGELQLGGSRKEVTVFFSDIRDFTKFSEGHTPEEVVDMLNEYFQIMVGIINRNGGVVDKFIGDAIMAVWGAPNASEQDTENAVRACLEMRTALNELNDIRIGRGQVPIKIGMGLHRGSAISGTIGSDERMEYTVIGDAVNQASRIESSTKAFGTDLLVSDDVADKVGEFFWIEEAGKAEVKGKSKPLTMFKVRGRLENGEPVEIRTPYSDYAAEAADKVKVAS